YTGKEMNAETGLVYFGARWYDGDTGRFVSTDLISGYLGNPLSQNRYQYCFNNPVTYTDPMGLDPIASFDVEVRAKREYNWELFEYIPMAFSEAWTRFWLEEWRNGLILSLSTQYDMKLKILEPNYSYQINIQPKGPDWEYLEKNEFFRADEKAVATLKGWYNTNPDIISSFVEMMKGLDSMCDLYSEANLLGNPGSRGRERNVTIFLSWMIPRYDRHLGVLVPEKYNFWFPSGSCDDCRGYVMNHNNHNSVRYFTWQPIKRNKPSFHQAVVVFLLSEGMNQGIVIDIWQYQSLSILSYESWK
ncbi:RHS repeat-associated core domain-containing protein, partial [bacterium]|nr:RHS repeat-associated core domain-containing protein [bacterium]